MKFWSNTAAAPTWWHTWERVLIPSYLRTTAAPEPKSIEYQPIRASVHLSKELMEFWNLFYRGSDWRMELTEEHVKAYLTDDSVYVYVIKEKGHLIASIVSTPCPLTMSHGGICKTARIIEGLVIHPYHRKKGLAGLMIAHMDYITSKAGPVCHLWSREESVRHFFSTAISSTQYSYIMPELILRESVPIQRLDWKEFVPLRLPYFLEGNWIRTTRPLNRRGDMDVWWGQSKPHVIVVVANTRRIETKTNKPIYEIVWISGRPQDGLLESIAMQYKGLIFTTLPKNLLSPEWITGRSGYHSWYIYNYVPPAFGSCTVELLREEL